MSGLDDRDRWLVPLSLFASYLANDGEELATMAPTMPATLAALPPWVPARRRAAPSQRHIEVGVAFMGVLYGAAVVDGIRTRGRGWLYQDVQWAFGLHGAGHLAASLALRRYTSGVATSPTVVLPQLAYAVARLRAAGVANNAHPLRAVALVGGWLACAHLLGARCAASRTSVPPAATS